MSTLEIILTVVMGVVALGVIIFYAIKLAKNKYLSKVYNTISTAMKEAEEKGGTGEDKKNYVLAQVKAMCKELKIPYDFIATLISKVIENIIKGYNTMIK